MKCPSPFRMTVDLNILDHLADGLYSSVAAVLTKAVANAWDADAENVSINANLEGDGITIVDDGIRMNEDSLNDSLSPSGLSPTHGGGTTPRGRPVMGRNGVLTGGSYQSGRPLRTRSTYLSRALRKLSSSRRLLARTRVKNPTAARSERGVTGYSRKSLSGVYLVRTGHSDAVDRKCRPRSPQAAGGSGPLASSFSSVEASYSPGSDSRRPSHVATGTLTALPTSRQR